MPVPVTMLTDQPHKLVRRGRHKPSSGEAAYKVSNVNILAEDYETRGNLTLSDVKFYHKKYYITPNNFEKSELKKTRLEVLIDEIQSLSPKERAIIRDKLASDEALSEASPQESRRTSAQAAPSSSPAEIDHNIAAFALAASTSLAQAALDNLDDDVPEAAMDTPLARLRFRYEKRLREITLPKQGFSSPEEYRAATGLSNTYGLLKRQQQKLGLSVTPKDSRVSEAERLITTYRRKHADRTADQGSSKSLPQPTKTSTRCP